MIINKDSKTTDIFLIAISLFISLFSYLFFLKIGTIANVLTVAAFAVITIRFAPPINFSISKKYFILSVLVNASFYLRLFAKYQNIFLRSVLLIFSVFAVAFCFNSIGTAIKALQIWTKRKERLILSPWISFALVFLYVMISLLAYKSFLPLGYSTGMDAMNQWNQIHGIIPYSDVHSIGHTVFLKLLLSIKDDYSIVVVVDFLLISLLYGVFAMYFTKKRIPFAVLFFLVGIFTCCMAPISIYSYPSKDVPYTFCVGMVSFFIMKLCDSEFKLKFWEWILFGLVLAGVYLFRLNGILIVVAVLLFLFIKLKKQKKVKDFFFVLTSFCIIAFLVNWYAYGVLKAESPNNGFSIQVFGTGIAAAVNDNPTEEEIEMIDEFLPSYIASELYSTNSIRDVIWTRELDIIANPELEVFNNSYVIAMGDNRAEIIKLYFKLLPNHLIAYARNIIYGTTVIWAQQDDVLLYNNISLLTIITLFAMALLNGKTQIRTVIYIMIPILINIVSIAISTITNEVRYLLPTITLTPMVLIYVLRQHRITGL